MISVEEAIAHILKHLACVGPQTIFIDQSYGRVLSQDISSRVDSPPSAVSSMDGYAISVKDIEHLPVKLSVVGVSQAGRGFKGKINSGQTVRIYTGAPIPEGADKIIIQEEVEASDHQILIKKKVLKEKFIRESGLDFSVGDILLKKGTTLSARDVGLLAAMNIPSISVRRKPTVAIIATGDEVVMPGDPIGPDQIISSNSLLLSGYVQSLGGVPSIIGIARDSVESLLETLSFVSGFDLILTTGGASVGDFDLVQKALSSEDWILDFYKIAMRPGKPLIFGHLLETPLLGLPGNPVSAGVCCVVFLSVIMRSMLGIDDSRPLETVRLGSDLIENDARQDYLRADLKVLNDGILTVFPFEIQDSSMISSFAKAKCLVVRPPFAPFIKSGENVSILRLSH